MSKLIMWNLITLDGFFEGPTSWSLDWLHAMFTPEQQQHSNDQLRSADALLFGRITYEGMAQFWPTAQNETATYMNSLPKLVFSSTLERAEWNNTRLVKEDAAAEVRELKRHGSGNLFVFGSATLSHSLIAEDLFDEFRIGLVPMILGSGRPLFGANLDRQQLRLLDATPMPSGLTILRYMPTSAAAAPA